MSTITRNALASINTPATTKSRSGFLNTKNAEAYIDEFGATWWYGKQRVVLTADLSAFTSATLADVTGLGFAVRASTRYGFRFMLHYQSAATTTGIAVGLTCPIGATLLSAVVHIYGRTTAASSGAAFQGFINASGGSVTSDQVAAATTNYPAIIEGSFVNGTSAGTLQLQAATEVAASGITPKQGSYGELWLL